MKNVVKEYCMVKYLLRLKNVCSFIQEQNLLKNIDIYINLLNQPQTAQRQLNQPSSPTKNQHLRACDTSASPEGLVSLLWEALIFS